MLSFFFLSCFTFGYSQEDKNIKLSNCGCQDGEQVTYTIDVNDTRFSQPGSGDYYEVTIARCPGSNTIEIIEFKFHSTTRTPLHIGDSRVFYELMIKSGAESINLPTACLKWATDGKKLGGESGNELVYTYKLKPCNFVINQCCVLTKDMAFLSTMDHLEQKRANPCEDSYEETGSGGWNNCFTYCGGYDY